MDKKLKTWNFSIDNDKLVDLIIGIKKLKNTY